MNFKEKLELQEKIKNLEAQLKDSENRRKTAIDLIAKLMDENAAFKNAINSPWD